MTSLARPGGNLTGVTFLGGSLAPKQFEVLHETVPRAAVFGLLENLTNPNADEVRREVQAPRRRGEGVKRREFITLLGGAAAASTGGAAGKRKRIT